MTALDIPTQGLPFLKMHGIGNDFVILDGRREAVRLTPRQTRRLADRKRGLGFDQLIILEPSQRADLFMRILNADGSEAGACGNATRCVAHLIMAETGQPSAQIETRAGVLPVTQAGDGILTVDMGPARLEWREIPLARAMDTVRMDYVFEGLRAPGAVSMGNPHIVFFVDDLDALPIAQWGPQIEHDPLFPERVNVNFAQIIARDEIRLRVWERGAGLTIACGSGACATLVAAHRQGLCDARARVVQDGGALGIEWREDGHVLMTGPFAHICEGRIATQWLAEADHE